MEKRRLEEARRRRRRKATPSHSQPRVELWIAPDGSSSRDQQSDRESDNDDLSSLSSIEVSGGGNGSWVEADLSVLL